jgi:hypothetical protein
MIVKFLDNNGYLIQTINVEIIPRLGEYVDLEDTDHYCKDDPMGSSLMVTQIVYTIKNASIIEACIWVGD